MKEIREQIQQVIDSLHQSPIEKAKYLNFPPLPRDILSNSSNKTPCSKIVVAVIDTGIDYTHPNLKDNIWVNRGEVGSWVPPAKLAAKTTCRDKSCNGIDDDGNGYIDDIVGWDFVNDQPLPYDVHSHGTHISGIISGRLKSDIGFAGRCPGATIMPLKYYDNTGFGYNNLQNTVRAIRYATKMGANIINYSGGGSDPAQAEKDAIQQAMNKGILFVAAAGNDGHNNDTYPYYPANYGFENIISVASTDKLEQVLPSSNFGRTVDVAALGLSVLSTLPEGRFGTMSGTSQATAVVTGAAALLASRANGKFNFRQVKHWIIGGTKPPVERQLLGAGVLSLESSLRLQKEELSLGITYPTSTPNNSSGYHMIPVKPKQNTSNYLYRGW